MTPRPRTTDYYLECKKQIEALDTAFMDLDKNSPDYKMWFLISRLLGSMCNLIGATHSDIRDTQNTMKATQETVEKTNELVSKLEKSEEELEEEKEQKRKVEEMYPAYKVGKWLVILLATTNIVFFAQQILVHIFGK